MGAEREVQAVLHADDVALERVPAILVDPRHAVVGKVPVEGKQEAQELIFPAYAHHRDKVRRGDLNRDVQPSTTATTASAACQGAMTTSFPVRGLASARFSTPSIAGALATTFTRRNLGKRPRRRRYQISGCVA